MSFNKVIFLIAISLFPRLVCAQDNEAEVDADESPGSVDVKPPLCTETANAGRAHKKLYAPAELEWGLCPETVKVKLQDRIAFESESFLTKEQNFVQYYTGNFAGIPARFELLFCGGTSLCAVTILNIETAPMSSRWEKLVSMTKTKFGKPKNINAPPATFQSKSIESLLANYPETENKKHMLELLKSVKSVQDQNRDPQLDLAILAGTWKPMASWVLKGGVAVFACAQQKQDTDPIVFLSFMSPESVKSLKNSLKAHSLGF